MPDGSVRAIARRGFTGARWKRKIEDEMPEATRIKRTLERIQAGVEGSLSLEGAVEFARQIVEDVREEAAEEGTEKDIAGFFSQLEVQVLALAETKKQNDATIVQAQMLGVVHDALRAAH